MRHDVVIIGAGPAGIRATLTLVGAGLRPLVIDEAASSGGQIFRRPPRSLSADPRRLYGFAASRAKSLHGAFDALGDHIDYRPDTVVWNIERDQARISRNGRPETIEWDHLILATGAMDRIIPFSGWTLPGVYTLGGAQIALKAQACTIGERIVFFGTGPLLYLVAWQYAKARANVVAVLDTAPPLAKLRAAPKLAKGGRTIREGLWYIAALRARGVAISSGIRPIAAVAGPDGAVAGFQFADRRGHDRQLICDGIGFGYGLKSETQLADLAGLPFTFDKLQRQWCPVEGVVAHANKKNRIYLAGDGARIRGAEIAELSGERAALRLLVDLGRDQYQARLHGIETRLERAEPFRRGLETAFPFPAHFARELSDETLVCRCEGITAGELRNAVTAAGASDINRAKAFTRLGMGRCQGRVCGAAAAEIVAHAAGIPIEAVGRLRGQPPVKPVALGTLASGVAP